MKLALTVRHGHDEELIFAQQLGADGVVVRLDVGDPADTDLGPVAHRPAVAGVALLAVELTGLPDRFEPWSDAVSGAVVAAAAAGVSLLLCASPTRRTPHLAADLEAVVAAATEAGVTVGLDAAHLLPEETALLPAGALHLELAVGLPPFAAAPGLPRLLAERARSGGVAGVRFEGGGQPLGTSVVDVAACVSALVDAGYGGLLRAGAPPCLTPDDDDWHPQGAAGDLGYLRALLQSRSPRARPQPASTSR